MQATLIDGFSSIQVASFVVYYEGDTRPAAEANCPLSHHHNIYVLLLYSSHACSSFIIEAIVAISQKNNIGAK